MGRMFSPDQITSFKNGDNDMISTKRTAGIEGDTHMSTMKSTAANLTRRAGGATMGNAGMAMFPIRLAAVAGLSFTHASDGTTILAGPIVDQAALYGLLRKVRDLGLPLLSVRLIDPKQADGPDVSP